MNPNPVTDFIPQVVPTRGYFQLRTGQVDTPPLGNDDGSLAVVSGGRDGDAAVDAPPPRRGVEESSERAQAVAASELGYLFAASSPSRKMVIRGGSSKVGPLPTTTTFKGGCQPIEVDNVAAWAAVNNPTTHPGVEKGLAEYAAAWQAVEATVDDGFVSRTVLPTPSKLTEADEPNDTTTTPPQANTNANDSSKPKKKAAVLTGYAKRRNDLVQQLLVTKLIKRDMRMYYKEICGTALVALQGLVNEGWSVYEGGEGGLVLSSSMDDLNSGDPLPDVVSTTTSTDNEESDRLLQRQLLHYVCRLSPGVEFWVLGAFETRPKGVHAPVVIFTDLCGALHAWKCVKLLSHAPTKSLPSSHHHYHLAHTVVPQFIFLSALSSIVCPPAILKRVTSSPSSSPSTQKKGMSAVVDNAPFGTLLGGVGGGGQGHHRSLYTWDALLSALARLRAVLSTAAKRNSSTAPTSLEVFLRDGVVECMRRRDHPLSACKNALVRTRADFAVITSTSTISAIATAASAEADGEVFVQEGRGLQLPDMYQGTPNAPIPPMPVPQTTSSSPSSRTNSFDATSMLQTGSLLADKGGDPEMLCEVGCRVLAEFIRTCTHSGNCTEGHSGCDQFATRVFYWLHRQCPHHNRQLESNTTNAERGEGEADSSKDIDTLLDETLLYAVSHTLQQAGVGGGEGLSSSPSYSSLLPLIVLVGYYCSAGPLETTTMMGSRQQSS